MVVYIYHRDITKELERLKKDGKTRGDLSRYCSKVGRELLEKGLLEQYHLLIDELTIKKKERGKPYISNEKGVYFNISHSQGIVVCAISNKELGIDIERLGNKKNSKLAQRIMDGKSYEEYLQSAEQELYFYKTWVRMESYLKYTGEGISVDLSKLEYKGSYQEIQVKEGYLCGIWSKEPLKVRVL